MRLSLPLTSLAVVVMVVTGWSPADDPDARGRTLAAIAAEKGRALDRRRPRGR